MISIKSFNGFTLNSTNYFSTAASAKNPPDAAPVFVSQQNADSVYSGAFSIDQRSIAVVTRITDLANLDVLESQLKEAVRPGTHGLLVGTFMDESRDYQLDCVAVSIHVDKKYPGVFTIVFSTGESAWHAVTEVTSNWAVTASGDTKAITVGGYSPTRLSMTVSPTSLPATGWAYQRLYQLVNAAGFNYKVRPWCITLDTATLVTAGKMQADGDDIMVLVDGVAVNRWLADMNTAATKIWFNLSLASGRNMTLKTVVASSGTISSLVFNQTPNILAALTAMPARGYVYHGTEWFEYTGKDLVRYRLTGITRAAMGTTMQAHAANDVFYWIEHSIVLLYGNASATAPSLTDSSYDDTKPVFDLSASANDSWVYTASTKFIDSDHPDRPGAWKNSITRVGNVSEIYNEQGNVEGAAPAMGMLFSTWYKSGKASAEKATLTWSFTHIGGISSVSMTGRKYRNTSLWPSTKAILLQRTNDGKTFAEVWNEATPTAEDTWETITHASAAITSNMKSVRFALTGSLAAQADTEAYFEVLTCTLAFVSANQPSGTLGSEKSNYLLNVSLKNTTNNQIINLVFPMLINSVLDLNGEEYEVTYDGVNAHNALSLDDNSRAIWIELEVGSNTLEITGENVGSLTLVLSWAERRL